MEFQRRSETREKERIYFFLEGEPSKGSVAMFHLARGNVETQMSWGHPRTVVPTVVCVAFHQRMR